ncbi:hypothetical protein F4677DRAFT_1880 [Hypoxylon crocopeplum]|nr:hypothetical protein F4677DRAFT_1880 [Hypoxylon crocopeplum]
MSVFSLIKRGREQAKEHNAKKAERDREESVKLPYRHVVTHAATDALSGAPSSWKHADRPRIMEQNKRRTAMAASETNMAGMPRVGSSLSYVSYASVYATPVVPLPKNYSYSNIPASWREQLANFQEGSDYFSHPGSVGSAKGKGREYVSPSTSAVPVPRPSPGQTSTMSSKGLSLSGSSANSSGSDDEQLEIKNKVMDRRSQNLGYQPSLLQQSCSSSEQSCRTTVTSSQSTIEAPVKASRHYPPAAQSTYFSAPRPVHRRASGSDASIPPISAVTERVGSATSSSMSGRFSSTSSIASIGVAIAPPLPPCSVATTPALFPEDYMFSEQGYNNATTASVVPSQPRQTFSTEQHKVFSDTVVSNASGQVAPSAPPTQRRRRRLSKSRPPSIDASVMKMSTDTIRPTRLSTSGTAITISDFSIIDQPVQKSVDVVTVVPTTESRQKASRKLSKNPESKPNGQKGRWISRLTGKTPTVAAH